MRGVLFFRELPGDGRIRAGPTIVPWECKGGCGDGRGGFWTRAGWGAPGTLLITSPIASATALSFAYALAATISGFAPDLAFELGVATGFAWWHPGVILAIMSVITLVSAGFASRRAVDPELATDPATATANA